MKTTSPETYHEFSVGELIGYKEDGGFHDGEVRYGKIKRITVVEWTPEEIKRLHNPCIELVMTLENGCTCNRPFKLTESEKEQLSRILIT